MLELCGRVYLSAVPFDHENTFFRTLGQAVLALGVLAPLGAAGFCVSLAGLVWVSQPLGGRLARRRTNPRSIWFGDVSQGRTESHQRSKHNSSRFSKVGVLCDTYVQFGCSGSLLAPRLDFLPSHASVFSERVVIFGNI